MADGQKQRTISNLDPVYQLPGATENHDNDPYGEIGCSMSKTNMAKKMNESTKNKVKNGIPKIPLSASQ